jgi:signal transduction histidine kinase
VAGSPVPQAGDFRARDTADKATDKATDKAREGARAVTDKARDVAEETGNAVENKLVLESGTSTPARLFWTCDSLVPGRFAVLDLEDAMVSDGDEKGRERVATDQSLRVERHEADAEMAKSGAVTREIADDVIRVARARADAIVHDARQATDVATEATTGTSDVAPRTERQRTKEDAALQRERASADANLDHERRATSRSLQHFLEVERSQTDEKLSGERVSVDYVISARDDFLGMVSHDLRALLGAFSFATELVAKALPSGDAGREAREHAVTSQQLVARMNRIIDDLLDITSIEAGKLAVIPTSGDANSPVRDIVAAFGPIAAAKGIKLDAELAPHPLLARFDEERVLQVLANLVSNAVRLTPASGTIIVRVEKTGKDVRFAVSDNGVGIRADQFGVVFERFRKLSRDRRGLGLGLHISKCIVQAHGGRIWVESELGTGCTFYFTIPAHAVPASAPPD